MFTARGKYECHDDRLTVSYRQDADDIRIIACKTAFSMTRKGDTELNMIFKRSSRTSAVLKSMGGEGSFTVFTKHYEKSEHAGSFRIVLEYELEFPQDSEIYHLEIFVKTDSEEK